MKVLLVRSVGGLGQKGAILEVSNGYARNFLFVKGLAIPAENHGAQKILAEIQAVAKSKQGKLSQLEDLLTGLQSHKFVFEKPATPEGALYARVTPEDIALEIERVFHMPSIEAKKVKLSIPIKHVGKHEAEFSHAGKKVVIKLEVRPKNSKKQ
jgi:large subunit ribosomal protein L9